MKSIIQLQPIYLTNVALYINSIDTMKRFIEINKKCFEVSLMLRLYTKRKKHENDSKQNYIPSNLLTLFPKIETIECSLNDIIQHNEIIQHIKQIKMVDGLYDPLINTEKYKSFCDKVIEMRYPCSLIYLQDFKNVCKVRIQMNDFRNRLQMFLGNKDCILKTLIIDTDGYYPEFNSLEQYKQIKEKIFVIDNNFVPDRFIKQMERIGIVHQVKMNTNGFIQLNENENIKELYKQHLFTKCSINGNIDLRECKCLEEVGSIQTSFIKIKGLQHLKTITWIQSIDYLPSSVEKFCCNDEMFNLKAFYSQQQEEYGKEFNCYQHIKEFVLIINKQFDENILQTLVNCEILNIRILINSINQTNTIHFPHSIKKLKIITVLDLKDELKQNLFHEISLCKNLISFEFIYPSKKLQSHHQFSLKSLKSLREITLSDESLDFLEFPLTIRELVLFISEETSSINLQKFKFLNNVTISSSYSNNCFITLPDSIRFVKLLSENNNLIISNLHNLKELKDIYYDCN